MNNVQDPQLRLQRTVENIERLKGGATSRLSWAQIYQVLDEMTEGLPLIIKPIPTIGQFGRGRIIPNGSKPTSVKSLGYPPSDLCARYGRCNQPGGPVLYAGIGTELVFSEIGARPGDVVSMLHMSPREQMMCVQLGALDLWRRTHGHCMLSDEIKTDIKAIYENPSNISSFLVDAFARDYFSRIGSDETYKLTSALTAVILNAHPEIAGLIYESVDHTAGACLAIKPKVFDTMLKPTTVQLLRITAFLGYGVYDFEEIARTSSFDDDKIIW